MPVTKAQKLHYRTKNPQQSVTHSGNRLKVGYNLTSMKKAAKKVLIISHDKVGTRMAGPGMRYHQIALELSKHFDVTLATFNPEYLDGLKDVPYHFTDIKTFDFYKDFDKVDVIFALWLSEEMIAYAKSKGKLLIFDLYAPVPVESLVSMIFAKKELLPEDDYNYSVSIDSYKRFLTVGDYFTCSNEVQKDFWTGYAFATCITPSQYEAFPLYDRLGICPMGTNLDELASAGKSDPLRKRLPQIKKDDFVLVWTGGIWDWFDALTPIKALKRLKDQGIDNVKLVFLATRHPNKDVPEMDETAKAFALAEELGLKDNTVFFLEGWLAYNERLDYFMAGDVAIYAHKPSIESRFSHRTRVLDHFLAGLPTLATEGDYFADLVAERNIGLSVEPLNDKAMAEAIQKLTNKTVYKVMQKNVRDIRPEFTWEQTLTPLVTFLKEKHEPRQVVSSPLPDKARQIANRPGLRRIKRMVPRAAKEAIKRHIVNKSRKP